MYINGPIKVYLDDLAAKKPAPGGGSAAALAAATGVGLMEMVSNYTIGNPKYKSSEEKVAQVFARSEKARIRLEELIDEDIASYKALSDALNSKNPGSDKDELFKEAINPPLEVCRISADCLKMCMDLAKDGNRSLITDTATAAILLEGAFFSAKFNVYINLKYIKDMDFVGRIHGMLAPLEELMPKLKEEILEQCEEVIG